MTTERVTISLPSEVREAAQQIAAQTGVPFSTVVNEALSVWLRSRLVDSWLSEYQAEFGEFNEDELRRLADETGTVYVPPAESRPAA